MKKSTLEGVRRDLVMIATVMLVVFLMSKGLDIFEALSGVVRRYDKWEIGEVLMVFVVLPIPIGIFALRRWRELGAEMRDHHVTMEALRQSEERYRLVFENASEGISVHQLDPSGAWRLVDCNPLCARMAGRSREELLTAGDLRALRVTQDAVPPGSAGSVFSWSRPDGRENYAECTLARFMRGDRDFVIALDRDITERRRAEAELLHAERMAAVGTLAGGVAHEFNNVHGVIIGYLELALERDDLPADLREDLETVYKSTARAVGVTDSLLAFVRKGRTKRAALPLAAIIEDTLRIVRREFRTEGIEVEVDLAEKATVSADPRQISQVILNLLINARQAMIDCEQRRLRIATGIEGGRAWVRVSDTGCGISQEDLARIFLPFYSTKGEHAPPGSAQAAVRGTGLGLSVCQKIVENHGGEIVVESRLGAGTTFTVRLPLAEAGDAERAEDQQPVRTVPGARIMILEDEADMRALLEQLLGAMKYEVVALDDGRKGLEMLSRGPFDLVLVDLQMPKLSGVEFLRAVGELPAAGRPVSVVITGKAEDPVAGGYAGLAVTDTIHKPFSNRELYDRVYSALAGRDGRDGGDRAD